MENGQNNINIAEEKSVKDYLSLIRNNILPVFIIVISSLVVSILYAVNTQNIYKATTSLKIEKPKGSILESTLSTDLGDMGKDRFIANEIEILKSFNLREIVSKSLIDSMKAKVNSANFYLIADGKTDIEKKQGRPTGVNALSVILEKYVKIEQKRGLDIVEISVESPSPYEAALMADTYAKEYRGLNLQISRDQLTIVKNFLNNQKTEKQQELNLAEEKLKNFQEKGGIVALDQQASNLVQQISSFEAQKNAAQIDLQASDKVLSSLKTELAKQDPKMNDYLKNFANETYLRTLQEQLAKLEVNRDLAIANRDEQSTNTISVKDLDRKIAELKNKLNSKIETVKKSIFASSPDQVKDLTAKIVAEEIRNQSLKISAKELSSIVSKYDSKFNELPKTSIELAKFQRTRESLEKLYTLVEEKYQEALINEQSQPGNVLIVDNARVPIKPSKPNRMLIIIVGFVLGGVIAVGYVLIKNYFDNTVKTPEDMQKKGINVLAWIPQIEGVDDGLKEHEFIVARKPDSIPSEAFRALRTRIQFSGRAIEKPIKTILVTSSAPQEGKTTLCVNLAGSFAQSNKKVLVMDCDLRKPRLHNVFKAQRRPGLIDYLYGENTLEEIIKKSEIPNLSYITTGTIPPNPAETLESTQMKNFIKEMESKYDLILLDSPPIIAVTDSEILSNMVDVSLLVVSAETTEIELMEKSSELLRNGSSSFLGAILNNFSYKSGYGSYYKYYYYYSRSNNPKKKPVSKA
jgi:tyrosine-protein kinase Etk/Wzc